MDQRGGEDWLRHPIDLKLTFLLGQFPNLIISHNQILESWWITYSFRLLEVKTEDVNSEFH